MFRIAIILAVLAGQAMAADGIKPGIAFKTPFAVDGTLVTNRATVAIDASGSALLTIHYVKGDTIETASYSLKRVDVPQPDPTPGPTPGPTPKPTPNPTPQPAVSLWGIVVEESSERTPQQAVVLTSPTVRALFKEGEFRVLDKDVKTVTVLQPYVARATEMVAKKVAALPILFLVELDGTVHYEGMLPATIKDMKTLVAKNKIGGAK